MNIKLAVLSAGFGCALSAGAFAMPMTAPSTDTMATPVRMVCNDYGRCWNQADNPGEAIARGVMRGVEGRSVYRRDWDGDRGYHRGWDRDRGYGERRRWDDDD
ncbi:MAG: hypothetical protein QOF41_665 [Methylobacteriaceae bacterium]|nr:hypothetical protein [Methylobacteriaceae bacterium]